MAKFNWVDITREDVIKAVKKFLTESPEYPEPKSTFLVYEGKKLPAKHIRGMAYAAHTQRITGFYDCCGNTRIVFGCFRFPRMASCRVLFVSPHNRTFN